MPHDTFHALPSLIASPISSIPIAAYCHPFIVRAAPIVAEHGIFQIHPIGHKAPARAWRPIIAIRDGFPSWTDLERAIAGDIIDLAAISLDGSKVIATLIGHANVIGSPQSENPESIYLRETPAAWLRGLGGAVLCQSPILSARFLRGFQTIVTDTVAYGETIQAALRRDYRGPAIAVRKPANPMQRAA